MCCEEYDYPVGEYPPLPNGPPIVPCPHEAHLYQYGQYTCLSCGEHLEPTSNAVRVIR
jgi:hypothetical protein